jgi:hypothetical protein
VAVFTKKEDALELVAGPLAPPTERLQEARGHGADEGVAGAGADSCGMSPTVYAATRSATDLSTGSLPRCSGNTSPRRC